MKRLLLSLLLLTGCLGQPVGLRVPELPSTESTLALVQPNGDVFCAAVSTDVGVVTAKHCVDDLHVGDEVLAAVDYDGSHRVWAQPFFALRLLVLDAHADLALLSQIPDSRVHMSRLAPTAPQLGDYVIAIGHPFAQPFNVTTGRISSRFPFHDDELDIVLTVAQLPVAPGNSGGPVYNERHELVAVVTGMWGSMTLITLHSDLAALLRR